mmetsp:Transcript_54668/g.97543  ORF Transcript_54668/g.97543 Transcript_54668/m.97543 type:complete len:388 (-) Transcript_54668:44-1207(-)
MTDAGFRPSSASNRMPRSNTPPRSGSAPNVLLLRICLDERVLGGVEIAETSTLADVRQSIIEDEISGVPTSYQFLFGGAPVSRRQETRRRAVDCFPFLTIISEETSIAPPVSALPSDPPGVIASVPRSAPREVAQTPSQPAAQRANTPGGRESPRSHAEEPAIAEEEQPEPIEGEAPSTSSGSTLELQITDGPLEGMSVTVGEEGARIGRHTSNTLVIPEAGISRFHCEIHYVDGEFCVKDLGSTTGTYFYLRPHGHFQMFPGLMIKLGETEMQVMSQTPTAQGSELSVLFYEGPLAGHKVAVPPSGITIGRVHDNSLILLQDGTVSAHHAMIFLEDGEFHISDLGSCNGTCVRLSPERSDSDWHPIMDGDILGAGCTKVRCRIRRG